MRSRILLLLLFSVMLALIPVVHPLDQADTVQVSAQSAGHAQHAYLADYGGFQPLQFPFAELTTTTLAHDPTYGWGDQPKSTTTTTAPPTTTTTTANAGSTAAFQGNSTGSINGYPCGGDLPPCYVLDRESGGDPTAYNADGCNGNGCYGLWQFSGEWAGKLGLPTDIASATVDQQNNAARTLWNGGRGCRNWAACG